MSKPISNDAETTRGFGLSLTKTYLSSEMSIMASKQTLDSTTSSQMTLVTQHQPSTDITLKKSKPHI